MYNSVQRARINSLDGLKVLAIIVVFMHHVSFPGLVQYAGDRAVQVFFIVSGFLVAHNYISKNLPCTWQQSCSGAMKMYKRFFPIHFITFLLVAVFITGIDFTTDGVFTIALNLSLLQSWSNNQDVFFSFNGVSWYLSSLLFCYFMIPPILSVALSKKRSIIVFFCVIVSRYAIEYIANTRTDIYFSINTHVFPPVRCLEFASGVFLYNIYMEIKSRISSISIEKWFFVVFSIIEITYIYFYLYMVIRRKLWLSANYYAISLPLILLIALESGSVGKLLANKAFSFVYKIQMEFYMFHVFVIWALDKYNILRFENRYLSVFAAFICTIILSVVFRQTSILVKDRVTTLDRKK